MTHQTSRSDLLDLPDELLLMVFEWLRLINKWEHGESLKVALVPHMLVCKRFSEVLSTIVYEHLRATWDQIVAAPDVLDDSPVLLRNAR